MNRVILHVGNSHQRAVAFRSELRQTLQAIEDAGGGLVEFVCPSIEKILDEGDGLRVPFGYIQECDVDPRGDVWGAVVRELRSMAAELEAAADRIEEGGVR